MFSYFTYIAFLPVWSCMHIKTTGLKRKLVDDKVFHVDLGEDVVYHASNVGWEEQLQSVFGDSRFTSRQPVDFEVSGWDSRLVKFRVDNKESCTSPRAQSSVCNPLRSGWAVDVYNVSVSYNSKLRTRVEDMVELDPDDTNVFLRIQFKKSEPLVAHVKSVNHGTSLTAREVEFITKTKSSEWITFIKKLAFEIVGCNTITLSDDASIAGRREDGTLAKMNARILRLAMGKPTTSVYERYGFENIEPFNQAFAIAAANHALKASTPFASCDDFRTQFESLHKQITVQQDGCVFDGVPAVDEQERLYNQVRKVVEPFGSTVHFKQTRMELKAPGLSPRAVEVDSFVDPIGACDAA